MGAVVELGDALDGELVRSRGMVVSVDTADGPLRMIGNPIRIDGARRSTARRRACTSTPTSCSAARSASRVTRRS